MSMIMTFAEKEMEVMNILMNDYVVYTETVTPGNFSLLGTVGLYVPSSWDIAASLPENDMTIHGGPSEDAHEFARHLLNKYHVCHRNGRQIFNVPYKEVW